MNSISNLLKKSKNNLSQKKISFLKKKIEVAIQINEKVLKSFSKDDFLESPDEFKKISNIMFKKKNDLITNSNLIINEIEEIILLEIKNKNSEKKYN